MSGTFEQNFPVLEKHVEDYRVIEQNRNMIMLSAFARIESRPADIKGLTGIQYRISEHIARDTVLLVPDGETLLRIHEQDPMEDLRLYFGSIRNVTA